MYMSYWRSLLISWVSRPWSNSRTRAILGCRRCACRRRSRSPGRCTRSRSATPAFAGSANGYQCLKHRALFFGVIRQLTTAVAPAAPPPVAQSSVELDGTPARSRRCRACGAGGTAHGAAPTVSRYWPAVQFTHVAPSLTRPRGHSRGNLHRAQRQHEIHRGRNRRLYIIMGTTCGCRTARARASAPCNRVVLCVEGPRLALARHLNYTLAFLADRKHSAGSLRLMAYCSSVRSWWQSRTACAWRRLPAGKRRCTMPPGWRRGGGSPPRARAP